MKKSLEVIKSWFETGDIPTQQQFYDTWDSFYHKDSGQIITQKITNSEGDIRFVFADGEEVLIEKYIPSSSQPIAYIEGLQEALVQIDNKIKDLEDTKVDKVAGKGLSTNDFTEELKTKLEGLQNMGAYDLSYIPSYLNFKYFGREVYGVLLEVPEKVNSTYLFEHNLNIDTYLRLEVWENGIPRNNPKMKIREDLTQLIYGSMAGIVGEGIVGTAPVGEIQTGELLLKNNNIEVIGEYVFPENKLVYLEYIKFPEGVKNIPDYAIALSAKNTIIDGPEGEIDFVVSLEEVNGGDANGTDSVEFRIADSSRFRFEFDTSLKRLNGIDVFNADWFYKFERGLHKFVYIGNQGVFKGNSLSRVGVKARFISPANGKGTQPLKVTVRSNAGGQTNRVNDNATEIIEFNNI